MQQQTWNVSSVSALFELPLFELVSQAYLLHKQHFDPQDMELCTLSNIKTGKCPEDCAYCPQSAHHNTGLEKEPLMDVAKVIAEAKVAKAQGSKRFCMGAAWRSPPKKDFPKVIEMIKAVKAMGLETCVTLGMLDDEQILALKQAGLDYYNHNVDTSREFYEKIITTRCYDDRINTLKRVANAGVNVCCGGILGMGETQLDRINMLLELYALPTPPKSIPINQLIAIPGTPLADAKALDVFELIKTIAVTRIVFPQSMVRLSAGREHMSDELQAWCFMAGANSIFIGDKLLTADNPSCSHDFTLLKTLGFKLPPMTANVN